MNKYIFHLLWIIATLFLISCKSNKPVVGKKQEQKQQAQLERKLEYYNDKYDLKLDRTANIALYEMIEEWLGVPHKDNGCEKSGTDCSCFVKMVYSRIYQTDVGKHSQEMYARTQRISQDQLTEGDLVFFKTKGDKISHVGIYLNNKKFVHVSTTKGVAINSLDEAYYRKTYTAAGKRPQLRN